MIEACQKHLIDNFDWKNRIVEVLERVSSKSLESALADFMTVNIVKLRVILHDEAELIAANQAKYFVRHYGKNWMAGINDEFD